MSSNVPDNLARRNLVQTLFFLVFRLAAVINGIALFIIIFFMVKNGWTAISGDFLPQPPMDSMTKGGILPPAGPRRRLHRGLLYWQSGSSSSVTQLPALRVLT